MTSPLVSIGMPVYNGAEYIREALDSLLAQSLADFELIVSDNCSTDDTVTIVEGYAARDNRIRLVRQPTNLGATANFLFVLEQSRGRYFMWAAHDDRWADDWLETLVNMFRPADIGVRGRILLDREGEVIAEKCPPDYRRGQWMRCFLRNEVDYRSHYTYSLFDREKLVRADLQTLLEDYYPDALFCYSVLYHGDLRMTMDTWHRYRVHTASQGATDSRQWRGLAKIVYRIHPARYYRAYWRYTPGTGRKVLLLALVPFKHAYAQASFWWRGARELITGVKYI